MSDWDSVTKIGKKHSGGGAMPRETVIKGKSALNAAQRSGTLLGSEKKYTTGNIVRSSHPHLLAGTIRLITLDSRPPSPAPRKANT